MDSRPRSASEVATNASTNQITGVEFVDSLLRLGTGQLQNDLVPGEPLLREGRDIDLLDQFGRLRRQFGGQPKLMLLHAALIVLLRRQISVPQAATHFRRLWSEQGNLLVNQLDLRWLVSACDTFADHPRNDAEKARAMLASSLVNTVKLYETERKALGYPQIDSAKAAAVVADSPGLLFDGLTRFNVGGGDMVANLIARLARCNADRKDPVQILVIETINRVLRHPTVFRRFRDLHRGKNTKWEAIE